MDEAIRNYARYRQEPERWMLGKFICPATRLEELAGYHDELFRGDAPFAFSVLGLGGTTAAEFWDNLRLDLEAIGQFRKRHGTQVQVDTFEIRFPPCEIARLLPFTEENFLNTVGRLIDSIGPPGLRLFFEIAPGPQWDRQFTDIIGALCAYNSAGWTEKRPHCRPLGFKLRCGGAEASAFPLSEQVAHVLAYCAELSVPLKTTAGLHHPYRHFDPILQTKMHGFLNLLVAETMSAMDEAEITAILEDEEPSGEEICSPGRNSTQ